MLATHSSLLIQSGKKILLKRILLQDKKLSAANEVENYSKSLEKKNHRK